MKEISLEHLSYFKKVFAVDKEKHAVILMTIKTFIRRFELYPELRDTAKLYAFCDEWKREKIFFMTFVTAEKQCNVFFDCVNDAMHHINIIKNALKNLDFRLLTFICSIRNVFRNLIFELQYEMNLTMHEDTDCVCFHMTMENALKIKYEILQNYKIKQLATENVAKINSLWPYRFEDSEMFLDYSIKYNISVGLFDQQDNLIAWCLRYDNGSLGVLQVDDKHLRKGFGEVVVRAIVRKIAEKFNSDVISLVVFTNEKSVNLFNKLGFKMLDSHTDFGLQNHK